MKGGDFISKQSKKSDDTKPFRLRPQITPDAQQNQLISLAIDRAKEQLLDGTASSQVITHFLKLAAEKEKNQLEIEKLREENKLLQARTEAIKSARDVEEMYKDAIKAMQRYSGNGGRDD